MSARWSYEDVPDQTGKTAIITGANSGLGFHTTRGLAAKGAKIIMACRNASKAEAARAEIQAAAGNGEVEVRSLDLSSLTSVRSFAEGIINDGIRPDLLINNAGVMAVPYTKTADGFEMQMGTNHLGHFTLTGLLLNQLANDARIINISSMAHRWTPGIDFDDLGWTRRRYNRWQAYGDSKLANLLFTFGLQRRLSRKGSRLTVAAAHPGYAATHLQYVAAEQKQSRMEKWVMGFGNALFAQPADMGTLPGLYAASAADVASGDYIGPGGFQQMRGYPRKVGCRKEARNEALADQLWDTSSRLTQVRYLD